MSRKVTKIPQIKQDALIEAQRLWVEAYCRVSICLRNNITVWKRKFPTTRAISSAIQTRNSLQCIQMLHLVSVLPTALATSTS